MGKVTGDKVGPHIDLLNEFPYLGPPQQGSQLKKVSHRNHGTVQIYVSLSFQFTRRNRMSDENDISREQSRDAVNEDLPRISSNIGYVVYSQVLSGAQYMEIAAQLESTPSRSSITP